MQFKLKNMLKYAVTTKICTNKLMPEYLKLSETYKYHSWVIVFDFSDNNVQHFC